jgi:hypothetical protein
MAPRPAYPLDFHLGKHRRVLRPVAPCYLLCSLSGNEITRMRLCLTVGISMGFKDGHRQLFQVSGEFIWT